MSATRILPFVAVFVAAASLSGLALAAEDAWGDLSIRFIYDGELPKPKTIAVPGGGGCAAPLADESLVIDPKSKGVANVVVWLFRKTGDPALSIHPNHAEAVGDDVTMTNANCRFEPHVAMLRTSQTLIMANADAFGHNMKCDPFNNAPFNVLIPAGGAVKTTFTTAEATPAKVECSIHPWMNGWLVIREDPYAAVSDKSGNLTIKNLPVGEWTFVAWQERAGYLKKATIAGKEVEWPRGRITHQIKAGANDLGLVKLQPALFERKLNP